MSWQMQSVAVGWQVWKLTNSALALGYVGLVQFLPAVLFILVTGHVADRFDRRLVVAVCMAALATLASVFAYFSFSGKLTFPLMLGLIFLIGTAHAFAGPASQALLPHLVPTEIFSNAVAWNSSIWQFASIAGPALGGLILGMTGNPGSVYMVDGILSLTASLLILAIRTRLGRMEKAPLSFDILLAGFRYVWANKVLLGALTLDLFAVLLGGAVTLLPVYASDILKVGPIGFGFLRAAPSVGAGLMAIVFAHLPPLQRAGRTMLKAVAVFGIMTIVFGLSRNFLLSLTALLILGAADMVSVVVRHTVVQIVTPPAMRGRVSAVNLIFIGASNQLGEFESGVTAHWFGTVPAVVLGGIGTLIVVVACSYLFPQLRDFGRLDQGPQTDDSSGADTPESQA
jgi:MFS family permease